MPPASHDAAVLRHRALALRHLSVSLSITDAIDLRLWAGADVWIGPTATSCCDDVTNLGRRLADAADDLIVRARGLEHRAAELEVLAAGAAAR